MNPSTDIDICTRLLRWELSAGETYARAIDLFRGEPVRPILEDVREDHRKNGIGLRQHVEKSGGRTGEVSVCCWIEFLTSVQGAAKLFGERSALVALLQGEEAGRAEYDAALVADGLTQDSRALISLILMPRLRRHISTLRGLTATR